MPKVTGSGVDPLEAVKAQVAKANGDTPHDEDGADDTAASEAERVAKDINPPDTVVVDGVTYYRNQTQAPTKRKKPGYQEVTINIAPYADRIMVDGRVYFQGFSYEMTDEQAASIHEMMARTWQHEASTGGANTSAFQRARNLALSPSFPGGRPG